jgi:heme-degrading monooxygenase HmoA
MFIGRVWHGLTREKCGDEYLERLERKRAAAYRRTPGNLGVLVFQRKTSGVAEFFVISIWESYEAIQLFTGSKDVNIAVYDQEDYKYLLFPEPTVSHYELSVGREMLLFTNHLGAFGA